MEGARARDVSYVLRTVMPQTVAGLIPSGIYYGWGALTESINEVFAPKNPHVFENQHGTFAGVIILALSVSLALPLRILLDKKFVSEFNLQAIGLCLITIGLFLGGVSVQYKILWLLYIGCAIPCGFGAQLIFLRIVFSHQLWFKRINYQNFGSGLFGFIIGIWAAFFFLISVPLEANLSLSSILYIYASIAFFSVLFPLLDIDDNSLTVKAPSIVPSGEETVENKDIELATISTTDESKGGDERNVDGKHNAEIGEIELSYSELLALPQMWILFFFFSAILTPGLITRSLFTSFISYMSLAYSGWGIKLSFISMLRVLYNATPAFSASMTAIYVVIYAFGRFFSGILADYIGVVYTFDFMLIMKIIILIAVPQVTTYLPRDDQSTKGCTIFIILICILGLMYGGSKALFYSIIFDVFGEVNYKAAFSIAFKGFGLSVIVGGITSAYSFSETLSPGQSDAEIANAITKTSSEWFYSMAGGMLLGLILLHSIKPVDYKEILKNRVEHRK